MSPPIPDQLFTVEIRDSESEPWRPMCDSGPDGTEDSTLYAWRDRALADEMTRNLQGVPVFPESRIVRWERVTGDG